MDNRFFPLPFQFDINRLSADLAVCESLHWEQHFNKNDYAGDWTGISLRSPSGQANDITAAARGYQDTPLLAQCPYFREILDALQFEKETVRLLALAPGSIIKEHRDQGLSYAHGSFRLHIPITTDDRVDFIVDNTRLKMDAGRCWYANFDLPHSVRHAGETRRIHLVIDGVRNEWSDQLFRQAGYDFELEASQKEYDDDTKAQIIEHLSKMDSEAARAIIAKLQVRKPPSGSQILPKQAPDLHNGWTPTGLEIKGEQLAINWIYMGEKGFSEPFFDETIQSAKRQARSNGLSGQSSSLSQLLEMAENTDAIAPTAFIFHVSRCGSTLLAQLLCTDPQNIVLSEVPILDSILRLPFQHPHIAQDTVDKAFLAVLKMLGKKRTGSERHLFVKTDCWHILFYDTLRRLFPQTPFLLLYRNPVEVLRSQQKQRGIQSIPATLEPALTGIPDNPAESYDLDGYFLQLLERIFAGFARVKSADRQAFLLRYSSGPGGLIRAVEKATGLEFSAETLLKMEQRSQFHAKRPNEAFEAEKPVEMPMHRLKRVMELFEQLEQK